MMYKLSVFIKIVIDLLLVKRPISSSRKINEETNRITLDPSKLEDSEMEAGGWAEQKLITTGRNAGKILLQKPDEEGEE